MRSRKSTSVPTSGIRPTRWMIRPPTVSYASSSGSSASLELEQVAQVVHGDPTVEPEGATVGIGLDRLDKALLDVVLVLDVADDLLDQVLDGDQAGGPAVLVDHDRDVAAGEAHLGEHLVHPLRLGHVGRGPGQGPDVDGLGSSGGGRRYGSRSLA